MESRKLKSCPICGTPLTDRLLGSDCYAFTCKKHGEYFITDTVLAMIENKNEDVIKKLPTLIENYAGKGIDGIITSYAFKH